MKSAATNTRNFRTFLLMRQFEGTEIGARLQLARKEAGFTQEQVASMAAVSVRSLQDYEAGKTIPYRHFRELAAIYRREPHWLLHGDAGAPLLEEVAETVEEIARGTRDAIERLERIEALLEQGSVVDIEATPRRR